MLIFIYILILVVIVAVVLLTKIVLDRPKPKVQTEERVVQTLDVNPYPNVNNECTFNVSLNDYHSLKTAGCTGGYTRYDIALDELPLKISIVYSDKDQPKTGVFVNDRKLTSEVEDIANIKFGIFDSKLFMLNIGDNNVYAVNEKGELIYNLEEELKENKIKEFAVGDKNIKIEDLDPSSFNFYEGGFEFNSKLDACEGNSKGSHYKVTYKNEKFNKPEFMNLIEC